MKYGQQLSDSIASTHFLVLQIVIIIRNQQFLMLLSLFLHYFQMNYFTPQIIYSDTFWKLVFLTSLTIFLQNIKLRTPTWSRLQVPDSRRDFHLPITEIGHHNSINQVGCTLSSKNQLKASGRIMIFLRTMTWLRWFINTNNDRLVVYPSPHYSVIDQQVSVQLNKHNLTSKDKSFKIKHSLQCPCVAKVLKQNIIQVMAEDLQPM